MTQDEIIKLANKAYGINNGKPFHPSALFHLEIFAKLVAQHEREACWNDISIVLLGSDRELTKRVFKAIRARGQV
jgi:hypothetical protein